MKHILSMVAATLLLALCSMAQQPPPRNDPRATPPDPSASPSGQMPESSAPQSQSQSTNESKGEKKLKGCLRSQGGSFMLEEKNGKQVMLSGGQDLSAHVGHTVTVHGSYSGGGGSQASAASGGDSGETFHVTSVEMVSDTCSADKEKGKSNPY